MAWIKLTQLIGDKPKDLYLNVDYIVRIGDSIGLRPGTPTNIVCTNSTADVRESVADVMTRIAPTYV